MNKRPVSVTIISWVFIAAGVTGLAYHITEFKTQHPFQDGGVWLFLIRLLAIVGGVFMLRGRNWARWLSIAWIGCHVILSAFHSLRELAFHSLLFAVFAYFLFRAPAAQYFRHGTEAPPHPANG
ncbi:MAG TPA: hypothetical protein VH196_01695 [Terriglobales bacterium]|nr:hypothetical protein [Terriglobales bacterium]